MNWFFNHPVAAALLTVVAAYAIGIVALVGRAR